MSRKRKEKKKADWLVICMELVIIVLVFANVLVAFNLYLSVDAAKRFSTFEQDSDIMSYELQNNNYAGLIQGKYMNELNGKNETKSYHALADYVEAATMNKIYVTKGYSVKAGKMQNIMDRSRIDMGNLTVFADKIDRMLER